MKLLVSTKQFKMYLDDDLVERIKKSAEKSGRASAQQLAEEILSIYLPVWNAVNDATRRAVEVQAVKGVRSGKLAVSTPDKLRKAS